MDSEWCIIRSAAAGPDLPYAVVHSVNKVLVGFATRDDAERAAIARAKDAYELGDESVHVTEYLDGVQREIWRPAAVTTRTPRPPSPATARARRSPRRRPPA